MIDTHCHLNFKAFENDWREVADRAVAAGVTKMIVVGADLNTSRRAVELANQHPALYAAVGIHPHHARQLLMTNDQFSINFQLLNDQIKMLKQLAREPRVVAIGEIGLDYHVPQVSKYPDELLPVTDEVKAGQKELLIAQLLMAKELKKPVILHSREAKEEVLQISQQWTVDSGQTTRGVFHCFGGSKKYLKRIIKAGFYVGFDGDITYVPDRLQVASEVPLDQLLTETDSPWLTPVPKRGERNEPKNVRLVAEAQAEVRGISVEAVERVTSENAEQLFGI